MEIDFDQFVPIRAQFLRKLAAALEVRPQDIWIAGLRRGCVIARIGMFANACAKLETAFKAIHRSVSFEILFSDFQFDQVDTVRDDVTFPNIQRRIDNRGEIDSGSPRRALTWLHLSDLHLGCEADPKADKAKLFQQRKVLSSLIDQLPGLLRRGNFVPDLVFFTGDIALSGTRAEYKDALSFFKSIKESLPHEAPFFFIPGNHDTEWKAIDAQFDSDVRDALNSKKAVTQYLLEKKNAEWRKTMRKRLANFIEFANAARELGQPKKNSFRDGQQIFLWNERKFAGFKVGVAGLNSAWLCTRKDVKPKPANDLDLKQLALGEPQMLDAIDALKAAHLRIALIHHPPAGKWFKEFEQEMQDAKFDGFDFVLRGHEHDAKFRVTDSGNGPWQEIAAGALFTESDRYTGCNAVRIDFDDVMMKMQLWRYYDKRYSWDVDAERGHYAGQIERTLPDELEKRIRVASDGPV